MKPSTKTWIDTLIAIGIVIALWIGAMLVASLIGGCAASHEPQQRVTADEAYEATIDHWYTQDGGVGEAHYREWVVSYVEPQQLVWSFDERIAHVFIPEHGPCLIYVANDLTPESECRALLFGFATCLEAPQAEEFCDGL